jgi:hypothetical protein
MQTLLDPAILFFALGVLAGVLKSNLEIPAPISRFLSLYLLMALGLKGGFALAHAGLDADVARGLAGAVLLAIAVPALGFAVLSRVAGRFDAAALAATYGSVSAVTFVTAMQAYEGIGLAPGGHMAAAMALMESPAIVMAVLFAGALRRGGAAASPAGALATVPGPVGAGGATLALGHGGAGAAAATFGTGGRAPGGAGVSISKVLHESFTDGGQVLLLGAMVVGLATGDAGKAAMQPFSGDLFKGMLAFFLLDMGLATARNLPALRASSPWLVAYAVLGPLAHAGLALALACALGLAAGDAAILMVLAASASYIAVPAVLRHAIPEASPALYVGLSLGLTFPFNLLLGIPLYGHVARALLG